MADCPNCGGILRYDIPSETVICDYCRESYDPEKLDTTQMAEETDRMAEDADQIAGDKDRMRMMEFHCPNCGGDIFSTDKDVTGVCSYCGSQVIFESRLVSKKRPQLIIPFKKTKEECRQIYAEYLEQMIFVPRELKDPEFIEGFRGIYMPYWISDVTQTGQVRFYSQDSKSKGKLVFDDTYRIEGNLYAEYDHFYHDGGSAFSDDLSEKLEPYQLFDSQKKSLAKPFHPAYLSGFYAEPADLDFEQYAGYFEDLADRQTTKFLEHEKIVKGIVDHNYASYARLDLNEPLDLNTENLAAEAIAGHECKEDIDFEKLKERKKLEDLREKQLEKAYKKCPENENKKELTTAEAFCYKTEQKDTMALFPVWFMAWKKNNRVAYLAINGQTGSVCADLPIDYFSFFKIFALMTAISFAVISYFTISVYMMPVLAAWLSAVVLHMDSIEMETIRRRSEPALIHNKRKSEPDASGAGIVGLIIAAIGFPIWDGVLAYITENEALATCYFWRVVYVSVSLIYAFIVLFKCVHNWRKLSGSSRPVPVFLLDAAAAVFSFCAVISNCPSDLILYSCSAGAFIAIAVTLLGMIRQYNISATRPLPQFEHRGGADHA